jgi:F0F1-type ATP synthase alpha subunit
MGELESAATDAEQVYLAVNQKAGYISMRTDELEETAALKAAILIALKQAESEK